ncbi:MAG TPA: tRNA lysidine(34) synthetase TilS [Fimbriimonadaceae bacterium]|nr:tRNA lysidine(34) synthetase TilS [Fimbriimonadaceae bacterium]
MLETFRDHLEQTGLIPPGLRVLVGYSGGADSTCLLHLMHCAGIDVVAAHLHHGMRPEADEELEKCAAFCDSLGIPFVSGRSDVPKMAADLKIGLEEAGREARYTFFQQAAFQLECPLIATAHTKSDHAETILLNLARGTGMAGLAGIPARRENIVRPLLFATREETRAYCEAHDFWFHEDPANSDISFSRARIRHRVLPDLRAINPGVETALDRLSSLVDEEDRFLNGMAAAALEQSEIHLNGPLRFLTLDCEAKFNRDQLASLPPVLFRRAVRLSAQALGGKLERGHFEEIEESIAAGGNGSVTVEGGDVVIEWKEDSIHVRQVRPTQTYRYALTVPGETISDEFGWQFTAQETRNHTPQNRRDLCVQLPKSQIKGSLYFRSAQPGDQLRPLGFGGSRKLSDLFGEAKLTLAARARLPILCDFVGPLWAPGVCLDNRMANLGDEEIAIQIQFGPVIGDPSHNKETCV